MSQTSPSNTFLSVLWTLKDLSVDEQKAYILEVKLSEPSLDIDILLDLIGLLQEAKQAPSQEMAKVCWLSFFYDIPIEYLDDFMQHFLDDNPELLNALRITMRTQQDPETHALIRQNFHSSSEPHLLTASLQRMIGQRLGAYQLVEVIGIGGMGAVFKAKRLEGYQQIVAIKVLRDSLFTHPHNQYLFHRERQILAKLIHSNIARIFDGGITEEGLPYYVMEYISGERIDRYCDKNKLNLKSRIKLFCDVCEAIHHAHQNFVVHRDIKPDNILVSSEGKVKVLDFGIAKELDDFTNETQSKYRKFTPDYAAPEQILGEKVTTATDVYGLGAVFYKIVTNQKPFNLSKKNEAEIYKIILEDNPLRPSDIKHEDAHIPPQELKGDIDLIIMKSLRKEQNMRYIGVAEMLEDIEAYLQDRPVKAQREAWRYNALKFYKRNRWQVITGCMFFLFLIGSASYLASQNSKISTQNERLSAQADSLRSAYNKLEISNQKDAEKAKIVLMQKQELSAKQDTLQQQNEALFVVNQQLETQRDSLLQQKKALQASNLALNEKQEEVERKNEETNAVLGIMKEAIEVRDPYKQIVKDPEPDSLDAMEKIARRLVRLSDEKLRSRPTSFSKTRFIAADLYVSLTQYEKAIQYFEEGLAQAPSLDTEGIKAHGMLCDVEREVNRLEEAEAHCQLALWELAALKGATDLEVATIYMKIGRLMEKRVDNAKQESPRTKQEEEIEALDREAEKSHKKAVDMAQPFENAEDPEYANILDAYGNYLFMRQRYREALEHFKNSHKFREKVLKPDNPSIGESLNNLAYTLLQFPEKNKDEIISLAEKSATIYRKNLLPSNLKFRESLQNTARIYSYLGRFDKSEEKLKEVLALNKRYEPDTSFAVAESYFEVGYVLNAQAKHQEAFEYLKEGYKRAHVLFNLKKITAYDYTLVLAEYAWQSIMTQNYITSEKLYEELILIERLKGRGEPMWQYWINYAISLRNNKKYAEAEPIFRRLLNNELEKEKLDQTFAVSLFNYASILECIAGQGRKAAADEAYQTLISVLQTRMQDPKYTVVKNVQDIITGYKKRAFLTYIPQLEAFLATIQAPK